MARFRSDRLSRRLLGSTRVARSACIEGMDSSTVRVLRTLNSGSVYTPGFVLDGREWQRSGPPSAGNESPGTLKLSVSDGEKIVASFRPATSESKPLELHVVRLGFGMTINVKAGENSGRKLQHDFVVLAMESTRMTDGEAELTSPATLRPQDANSRSAIAAWVTEPGKLEPIQAVGGWLR